MHLDLLINSETSEGLSVFIISVFQFINCYFLFLNCYFQFFNLKIRTRFLVCVVLVCVCVLVCGG